MNRTLRAFLPWTILSLVAAGAVHASPQPATKTTLVVLADHPVEQTLWPTLVSALRQAAASGEAPVSGDLEIVAARRGMEGPAFPERIEVELLGHCDALWNQDAPTHAGPLGWVLENSGKIAPVIYVDCAQLDNFIWPWTRTLPRDQRLQAASEAIAHVIFHEWTHVATQSAHHASRGLMQPELSIHELITPDLDVALLPGKEK